MRSWIAVFLVAAPLSGWSTASLSEIAPPDPPAGPQYAVASAPAKAKVERSGRLRLHVSLKVSPSLPKGTSISFYARAFVGDDSYTNEISLSASAKVSGGKATATLILPYTWHLASKKPKVSITVNIDGSASGDEATYTNSGFYPKTIALPADGATTDVDFNGSI